MNLINPPPAPATATAAAVRVSTVICEIAQRAVAVSNCIASGNADWRDRHESAADQLAKDFLPSGSGIDCGTKIDWEATLRTDGRKVVFSLSYHHMNESGYYDGWTEHKATVSPDWCGVRIAISGRNRNDVKEYLAETLQFALEQRVSFDHTAGAYVPAQA